MYAGPMHRAVCFGLVVLGAAMAVYGAASLTGGWFGTPPWQDPPPDFPAPSSANDKRSLEEEAARWAEYAASLSDYASRFRRSQSSAPSADPRPPADGPRALEPETLRVRPWWHKWTGLALSELGVVAISVGAWPRRRAKVAS